MQQQKIIAKSTREDFATGYNRRPIEVYHMHSTVHIVLKAIVKVQLSKAGESPPPPHPRISTEMKKAYKIKVFFSSTLNIFYLY
jgi:hypothetical protein